MKRNSSSMKKNRANQDLNKDPYTFDLEALEGFDFGKEDRIAFLSSQSRTYFPERPGTSRFAVANAPNLGSPEDAGPLKYSPKDPSLIRPISLKGYGIGGLSGPRFAKDFHEKTPPPWHYQSDVVPPIKTYEPPKDNYLEFLRKSIAQTRQHGSTQRESTFRKPDIEPYKVPRSELIKYKPTFKECANHIIAFGSSKRASRLGADNNDARIKFQTAGVGHYEIANPPSGKLNIAGSFGMGPNRLIPSVNDRCVYKAYDTCFECHEDISTADYYRTPKKIRNPLAVPNMLDPGYLPSSELSSREVSPTFHTSSNLERDIPSRYKKSHHQPSELPNHNGSNKLSCDKGRGVADATTTTDRRKRSQVSTCVPVQRGLIFVNLCRKCYCNGIQGQSKHWNREFLTANFKKTRNCSYIHEHQNIEHFIHKTSCKAVNKLRRRETLLAKYYADDPCIKVRKERV